MGSNAHIFLEYVKVSEGEKLIFDIFVLQLNYDNFNQPLCLLRNQYGFIQELRFQIKDDSNHLIESMRGPAYFSNMLAYCPYYISNFELGQFMYPILLRPFVFNSKYYNYYTQLYYFYLVVSFCTPPYYYINIPFHHVEDGKDFYMIFIYRHPVVYQVCPMNYQWSIYKILVPISHNSCLVQLQLHQKFKTIVTQIFENTYSVPTNNLPTKDLIPEALWTHFTVNYTYRYGFNYALNGVFPSNNGSLLEFVDPNVHKN